MEGTAGVGIIASWESFLGWWNYTKLLEIVSQDQGRCFACAWCNDLLALVLIAKTIGLHTSIMPRSIHRTSQSCCPKFYNVDAGDLVVYSNLPHAC